MASMPGSKSAFSETMVLRKGRGVGRCSGLGATKPWPVPIHKNKASIFMVVVVMVACIDVVAGQSSAATRASIVWKIAEDLAAPASGLDSKGVGDPSLEAENQCRGGTFAQLTLS